MLRLGHLVNLPPILDFEASSLSDCSYPISAGLFIKGEIKYWIIKPEPEWIDWSLSSQAIHGLKRSYIEEVGISVADLRLELEKLLIGVDTIYSDNPEWELRWLSHLGKFKIEILDVKELASNTSHETWRKTFESQFRVHDIIPHRADHDVLAMCFTLHELKSIEICKNLRE